MRLALCQSKISSNIDKNLHNALFAIEEASANNANIICFPELCLNPFFPQFEGKAAEKFAIAIDSDVVKQFREKCRENDIFCVPNFYFHESSKFYDASPFITSNGEVAGVSKMVHIAQSPCFYEQDYYSPSDTGFKVFHTPWGKVGIVICFDRHLPESIRTCALLGAQLVLIPTANTKAEPLDLFEAEMRVAAMQNTVFIAMCNRVGIEDAMEFAGESLVADSDGNIVAKGNDAEQIIYADIDPSSVEKSRQSRPFLSLRRPET